MSGRCLAGLARFWKSAAVRSEQASQLVEFAVTLPLLVVFVVGIFDFSNAFTLKQRLTNIARDAARDAAYGPSSDLAGTVGGGLPVSVVDAFQIVDNYLNPSSPNNCGYATTASGLTWKFTASGNGCPWVGLQITVNRAYYFPQSGASTPTPGCTSQNIAGQTAPLSTCVSIQYPYPWKFGQAASLLGAGTILLPQISAVAVSLNEN
jgi:Flp pilus assembly protein TadG